MVNSMLPLYANAYSLSLDVDGKVLEFKVRLT